MPHVDHADADFLRGRAGGGVMTRPIPVSASEPADPMYDAMMRGIDLIGGAMPLPEPRLVVAGRLGPGAAATDAS